MKKTCKLCLLQYFMNPSIEGSKLQIRRNCGSFDDGELHIIANQILKLSPPHKERIRLLFVLGIIGMIFNLDTSRHTKHPFPIDKQASRFNSVIVRSCRKVK